MKGLTGKLLITLTIGLALTVSAFEGNRDFLESFRKEVARYLTIGHASSLMRIQAMFESQESNQDVLNKMYGVIDNVVTTLEEQGKFNEDLYNKLMDSIARSRDLIDTCLSMALDISAGGFGVITGGFIPTGLNPSHYQQGVGKLLGMVGQLCTRAELAELSSKEGGIALGVACMKCKVPPSMFLVQWDPSTDYEIKVSHALDSIGDQPFMK